MKKEQKFGMKSTKLNTIDNSTNAQTNNAEIVKRMPLKQKLIIRFTIFSSIIFFGLIVLLYLCKYTQQIIDEKLIYQSGFIIGIWFWLDKKLLYFKNLRIISLLLCSAFLFVVVIFVHHTTFAPVPLASVIGRIIANKKLDGMRNIDLEAKDEIDEYGEGKAKMLVYCIITGIITAIIDLVIHFCLSVFN